MSGLLGYRGLLLQGQEVDPFWANVVALLHFDGTNGSTVFTDAKGHTFTAVGAAALSTAQQKFGSASLALNGTNSAIVSATSTDWEFGAGNFTIELFARPAIAVVARMELLERWTSNIGWGMQIMDTGFLRAFIQSPAVNGGVAVLVGPGATTVTHNTWHHVALVRDGSTMRLFLDGVSQGTAAFAGTLATVSEPLNIGYDNSGSRWVNGNLDALRITKGVARYTGNFTPPDSPFPAG